MTVTPVESTRARRTPRKTIERRSMPRTPGRVPLNIVLGLLMVYFLIPFWWLIVNSSKSSAGLFGGGLAACAYVPFCGELGAIHLLVFYGGPIIGLAVLGWLLGPPLLRW